MPRFDPLYNSLQSHQSRATYHILKYASKSDESRPWFHRVVRRIFDAIQATPDELNVFQALGDSFPQNDFRKLFEDVDPDEDKTFQILSIANFEIEKETSKIQSAFSPPVSIPSPAGSPTPVPSPPGPYASATAIGRWLRDQDPTHDDENGPSDSGKFLQNRLVTSSPKLGPETSTSTKELGQRTAQFDRKKKRKRDSSNEPKQASREHRHRACRRKRLS